ncbi:MAG: GtrA family protein [Arachidicoccus sp.]|nr:GtrA family protein [Arachidicoccus sp.]
MNKLHVWIKDKIFSVVDFFYPPFKKLMPLQTFRYAACGGANLLLSLSLFFIFFHYVVSQKNVPVHFLFFSFVFSPHIAAFILSFLICTPIGFYLSMYVVFPGSHLRRRIQFFRYIVVCIINFFLNAALLKLFVEVFHIYPSVANLMNTVIIVSLTYVMQRYFSFRQKKEEES